MITLLVFINLMALQVIQEMKEFSLELFGISFCYFHYSS